MQEQKGPNGALPVTEESIAAFAFAHYVAGVRGKVSKHMAKHVFGEEMVASFSGQKLGEWMSRWQQATEDMKACPECKEQMLRGVSSNPELVSKIADALAKAQQAGREGTFVAGGTEVSLVRIDPEEHGRDLKIVTPQCDEAAVGFLLAAGAFKIPPEMAKAVANALWDEERVQRVGERQLALMEQVEKAERATLLPMPEGGN